MKETSFARNREQLAITVTWKKRLAMVGLEGAAKLGLGERKGGKERMYEE